MNSGSLPEAQAAEKTYPELRSWSLVLAGISILDMLLLIVLVTEHAAQPALVPVADLAPFVYLLTGASVLATSLGVLWVFLRYPKQRKVILVLLAITLGLMVAHLYTINDPATPSCYGSNGVQGCVMDEIYYVPAAQALLSGEKCGPYLDNCNLEHPFLGKGFIAAGIALFGNNDFGWRFFEGLLGTLSIPIVFYICLKFTKDTTLSLYAAFLLAFETFFFVQSSIAVIDIQMIFLGLVAFLAYLADIKFGILNRYVVSGLLLGLCILAKEIGVFLAAFLIFYNLAFGSGTFKHRVVTSVGMSVIAFLLFIGGLQLYDSLYGTPQSSTFVQDISYILSYGASLKGGGWSVFANSQPPYITPLYWFIYYFPISYDVVRVTVSSGTGSFSYVSAGYFGVPDLFETWFVYIWVPYVVYLAYKKWKARIAAAAAPALAAIVGSVQLTLEGIPIRGTEAAEADAYELGKFAVMWLAFTFVPYILLYAYGRVTYPYYILSGTPALAIGMAYAMTRKWFPREVVYIMLGGVFAWFFIFYPDKSFLPTQLRVLLGH
ncbi:MAG: glycosyltransferase family 39 protein [Thaumarchaeota archaeon]|nr:glycosyltransferase family 39 protein [Nitrososphaerota archaeon]